MPREGGWKRIGNRWYSGWRALRGKDIVEVRVGWEGAEREGWEGRGIWAVPRCPHPSKAQQDASTRQITPPDETSEYACSAARVVDAFCVSTGSYVPAQGKFLRPPHCLCLLLVCLFVTLHNKVQRGSTLTIKMFVTVKAIC